MINQKDNIIIKKKHSNCFLSVLSCAYAHLGINRTAWETLGYILNSSMILHKSKIEKFTTVLMLFITVLINSGYSFADKLPDWQDLNNYTPSKIEFQKTSLDKFTQFCPDSQKETYDNNLVILNIKTKENEAYDNIRVGFTDKKLDWIEFNLNTEIKMEDFVQRYGFPREINSSHSEEQDYYNYAFFNVSTDKKHAFAQQITFFEKPLIAPPEQANTQIKFFDVFPYLIPGETIERKFIKDYPDLLPYMEGEYDVSSSYTLIDELGDSANSYSSAILRFEHGLLSWINLTPRNMHINDLIKIANEPYKIEKTTSLYEFYDFSNFIIVVNKKTKKINSIGVVKQDKRF